jgi:transmembrane protein 17
MADSGKKMFSSLPLQMMLFFNFYYLPIFFLSELVLMIYKGSKFVYPSYAYGLDISSLVFFAIGEQARLLLASQGNKKEELPTLVWSLGLAFPILIGLIYFVQLQTFVVRADVILNGIYLFFLTTEMLFSLWACRQFYANHRF